MSTPTIISPLTPEEAAKTARVSRPTIYAALISGELKGHQRSANGRWRIFPEDLNKWMRGE